MVCFWFQCFFLFVYLQAFWYDTVMNYIEKFKVYPLTYSLMALSIMVFILGELIPSVDEYLYYHGVLHGYSVVVKGEIYRLVTSTFLHSDGLHIVMNMLSLYIVGTMVEKIFSKIAYLTLYFMTAFFGAYVSIYMHMNGQAVGASGAIFGLFGALAGFAFVHRHTMKEQFIDFMKNFGVILLINLVIGFVFPSIDVAAHVGGLVAGMIGGFIVAKHPKLIGLFMVVSMVLLWMMNQYLYSLYLLSLS